MKNKFTHFLMAGALVCWSSYTLHAQTEVTLADPDAGCRHETDEKIVSVPFIPKQAAFQVFIIRLADHVIQICFLLDFYHGKMPGIELFKIQVGIQSPDPLVDGLRLVVLEQKDFV